MKPTFVHKQNFTLGELLEITKDCNPNARLLNSCFYPETTLIYLEENNISYFDKITDFHLCYMTITATNDLFSQLEELPFTLNKLKELNFDLDCFIDRDVEDGFIYHNYNNIVFNKDYIILC